MVAHTWNHSIPEVKPGEALQVQGQTDLHSKTLSEEINRKELG